MNELKQINTRIAKKQIGRIVIGISQVILGMVLIGRYMYQKGITDEQAALHEDFPEEYAAMQDKIVRMFEKS